MQKLTWLLIGAAVFVVAIIFWYWFSSSKDPLLPPEIDWDTSIPSQDLVIGGKDGIVYVVVGPKDSKTRAVFNLDLNSPGYIHVKNNELTIDTDPTLKMASIITSKGTTIISKDGTIITPYPAQPIIAAARNWAEYKDGNWTGRSAGIETDMIGKYIQIHSAAGDFTATLESGTKYKFDKSDDVIEFMPDNATITGTEWNVTLTPDPNRAFPDNFNISDWVDRYPKWIIRGRSPNPDCPITKDATLEFHKSIESGSDIVSINLLGAEHTLKKLSPDLYYFKGIPNTNIPEGYLTIVIEGEYLFINMQIPGEIASCFGGFVPATLE